MKRLAYCVPIAVVVLSYGCASLGKIHAPGTERPSGTGRPSETARSSEVQPAPPSLKSRLDFVIENGIRQPKVAETVGSFALADYDIQDPNTFWGHRAVGGGAFSEYYLTYRKTYVILLLKDIDEINHTCIDARIFPRTDPQYELTTGRVQVDDKPIDENVIVLVNKKWLGAYTTDIRAAFKANAETGRIEDLTYHSIRVYREE